MRKMTHTLQRWTNQGRTAGRYWNRDSDFFTLLIPHCFSHCFCNVLTTYSQISRLQAYLFPTKCPLWDGGHLLSFKWQLLCLLFTTSPELVLRTNSQRHEEPSDRGKRLWWGKTAQQLLHLVFLLMMFPGLTGIWSPWRESHGKLPTGLGAKGRMS